ncbi:type VI secretion system baseplate subunit TssK [Aliamphritea ceti]|uniref:type VI secretion system baseplate subunit TssK n=1 Tax=Aliamphritea ceti TaxID=1524258 RepID=UPI0021C2A924|nr:type VI secretion system baseplate subunit TssK [Aliamphritea ceti]
MTTKVIWHEGMFLRPHHFQQFERHVAKELTNRSRDLTPYSWGLSALSINQANLEIGELTLDQCAGVFPDGTGFSTLTGDAPPLSIRVPDAVEDAVVYLAIPLSQHGAAEVGEGDHRNSLIRYLPRTVELLDSSDEQGERSSIQVGELRMRLFVESARNDDESLRVPQGYTRIAIAHIEEVKGEKIRLRQAFIPTVLHIGVSRLLSDFVTELHSLVMTRARELAGRVAGGGGKGGVAEVTDFMLLQILNRLDPVLNLLSDLETLHPLALYERLLGMAGELSTFMKKDKRSPEYPKYEHEALYETFAPLFSDLRDSFGTVLENIAESIALSPPQYGIRAARIHDRALLKSADFVLAVNAQVPQEKLRKQLPAQMKIGPVEQIRELISSALPGIPVSDLPVAPREIPYHAGFTYFQLDTSDPIWKNLDQSGGIAFHIGGDFPGLECQFWAIKRR